MRMRGPVAAFITKKSDLCKSLYKYLCFRVSIVAQMAFAGLFALSGAIGPILGQNLGAQRFDRLRSTMRDSLKLTLIYVLVVWFLLAVCSSLIAQAFDARDLGQIVDLCLQKNGLGYQVFNAGNDHNGAVLSSKELAEKFFPNVPIKRELEEHEALFSNRKIREVLGFKEQHNWRKYVKRE